MDISAAGYRVGTISRTATHSYGQHATIAAVAAGTIALGLAGGGSSATAFSVAALAVWSAILVAVAAGLFPREEPPQGAIVAGGCVAGLVALIAISLGWASDDAAAFEDLVRGLFYLGLFVLVVIGAKRGEAGAWLHGLALGLVIVVLLALGSRFEPGLLGDTDAEISRVLAAAAGRLSYPIGYWNGLAALAAIAAILLTWLGARTRTRLGRALATGSIPLVVLAIYASTSRGGFAALAIGLGALVAAGPRRFPLLATGGLGAAGGIALILLASSRRAFLDQPETALAESQGTEMLLLSVAAAVIVALARFGLDPVLDRVRVARPVVLGGAAAATAIAIVGIALADPVQRFESFKQPPAPGASVIRSGLDDLTRGTSSGRYQYWGAAYEAFRSEPLTGIGSGEYEWWWNANGTIPSVAVRNAHSLFLESLAELGIAGGALSLGFFAVAGFVGWRRRGMLGGPPGGEVGMLLALLAAGAFTASIEWIWSLPAVFGPIVLAAALLTGPATLPALAPRVAPPMAFIRTRRRFAGGVGLLLVAWLAICAAGLLLLSERSQDRATESVYSGDGRAAISAAAEAKDLQPWASEPRVLLAQGYRAAGDIAMAQVEIAEAIERSPQDFRLYLVAAELDLAANDVAGAKANVKQALELAPVFEQEIEQLRDRLLSGRS